MGRAENKVAKHLKKRCAALNIVCEKIHAEDRVGCPDYLLTFPSGRVRRVETKSDSGVLSPVQTYYARTLAKNNSPVFVPTTPEEVEELFAAHYADIYTEMRSD